MNFASTLLLAFAMSTDAFAAAIGKGACLHNPRFSQALRMGAIFGIVEAVTPVVGWGLGRAAAQYVTAWDHWIAFGLLGGLGLLMIKNGFTTPQGETSKRVKYSFWILVITAFATSIDAMAVGVSLAFLDIDILITALAIGLATMLMVSIGVMLGRVLGAAAGQRTEIAGGIILIGIGSLILVEHLGVLA